jgi:hypothetical protein
VLAPGYAQVNRVAAKSRFGSCREEGSWCDGGAGGNGVVTGW